MNGYGNRLYPQSLAEFGRPRELARSGGWLLERRISDSDLRDAMGCYPLFCCGNWHALPEDLELLSNDLVSVTLVADPFGSYSQEDLRRAFPDLVVPFKDRYIVEFPAKREQFVSKHHRYYARQALKRVDVHLVQDGSTMLDEWCALYDALISRHALTGIKAFSRTAFAQQFTVPGFVAFRARAHDRTVAAHLWYLSGDVAYSHLAASSDEGYAVNASYAIYWEALQYFSEKVRWVDLGAAAGTSSDGKDGLDFFKRGWATGSRSTYLCGRVLNREAYEMLTRQRGVSLEGYFPAYRRGEF